MSRAKFPNKLPFKKRRELYKSHKLQYKASSIDTGSFEINQIHRTVDSRRLNFENSFCKNSSGEKLSPFKVISGKYSTENLSTDQKAQGRSSLPVAFNVRNDNIIDLVKHASSLLVKMKEECVSHKERMSEVAPFQFSHKRKTRSAFSNKSSSEILSIISKHATKYPK